MSLPSADLVEEPRAKPPSVPPPLPPKRSAARQSERIAIARPSVAAVADVVSELLSNARREIDFASDGLTAASTCLDALDRVVHCRVSFVHWLDVVKRDFVVVHARGEAAESMVLERASHDDPLLRIAMTSGKPFPWDDLRKAPVSRLARYSELGSVRRVLVCPIVSGPRWLGAIELVDPVQEMPFCTGQITSARYLADRYAMFLKAHGQVIDIAKIARFATRSQPR